MNEQTQKLLKTLLDQQSRPRLAGVIGHPVDKSLSPEIHHYWLKEENCQGHYIALDVLPTQYAFHEAISDLKNLGFKGVNVTMPHKENALVIADEVSPAAKKVGAANMLTFGANGLYADNSDVEGFSATLTAITDNIGKALILGAGGAARAILVALIEIGIKEITIANRSLNRADNLKRDFQYLLSQNQNIEIIDWENCQQTACQLVVNTTSLGMHNMPPLEFTPDRALGHKIIVDIVYNPLQTQLLRDAKNLGLITASGLDMLMHQAVRGYETWLGKKAVVNDGLKNHCLKIMNKKKPPSPRHKSVITIGLTGSIGMGKSTIARMFKECEVELWDADTTVHKLYDKNGAAIDPIKKLFPGAIVEGRVDRKKLSAAIQKTPDGLSQLETILHPMVARDRARFLQNLDRDKTSLAVFDIPLLFEKNYQAEFDVIVVVTAPLDVQRARVLARDNMSEEKFEFILAQQMPDAQKTVRADYVVHTDRPLDETRAHIKALVSHIFHKFDS